MPPNASFDLERSRMVNPSGSGWYIGIDAVEAEFTRHYQGTATESTKRGGKPLQVKYHERQNDCGLNVLDRTGGCTFRVLEDI